MADPQPIPDGDNGQKPPTPENPTKQRHQLGTPQGESDATEEPAPK